MALYYVRLNLFISYVINKFRYKTTILYTKLR
nr:MAG TPA: hypothetical protein [Caudoviricetes sp.]